MDPNVPPSPIIQSSKVDESKPSPKPSLASMEISLAPSGGKSLPHSSSSGAIRSGGDDGSFEYQTYHEPHGCQEAEGELEGSCP